MEQAGDQGAPDIFRCKNGRMMSGHDLKYFVVAPSFDEDVGGIIFQHELVNALNGLGENAFLLPQGPIYKQGRISRLTSWLRPPPYRLDPQLDTPVARRSDIDDRTVVIYPEITLGNPLRAKNVVRWLLYKPGLRHPYEFTEGEMFFRVFEKADIPELTGGAPELFLWKTNHSYTNEGRPDRRGVCYILRKGSYKPRIPETEAPDAIQIDGLGHEEINELFNRCEVFYSYDEATMYSQFAAICGCLSVVIPGEHNSRAAWASEHDLYRYGVAYGLEDTEHALATRDRVPDLLHKKEEAGLATVRRFVKLTKERFGNPTPAS